MEQQIAFAYRVLAPFGITVNSTMKEVLDVAFDLMGAEGGMTVEQRLAWDVLRKVETRLVADFLQTAHEPEHRSETTEE